jgi:hypothetical protein
MRRSSRPRGRQRQPRQRQPCLPPCQGQPAPPSSGEPQSPCLEVAAVSGLAAGATAALLPLLHAPLAVICMKTWAWLG